MFISLEDDNSKAHIILLMTMTEDIENEFKVYEKIMDLWITLNERFGNMSLIKYYFLTIKFDTYKKCPDHTMKRHLRGMSNMINEVNDAGQKLINEQEIQAVIYSLLNRWEHMRMHLTHSTTVMIF